MKAAHRLILLLALSTGVAAASEPTAHIAGLITDPRLAEASGAVSSRVSDNVIWVINDSGNPAELLAMSPSGSLLSTVSVRGAQNRDWEDLASFDHGQGPFLAIADTGDNEGKRQQISLYLVAEPPSDGSVSEIDVHQQIEFTFPDGPHDVESLIVDPKRPRAYMISKRTTPPALYSVDLRAPGPQVARLVAQIPRLPTSTAAERKIDPRYARYRHQPTAMDISCDGRELWVLTYSSIQRFLRQPGESWARAVTRRDPLPLTLPTPLVPQAEAIAFTRDCSAVLVLSEKTPGPVLRYPLKSAED